MTLSQAEQLKHLIDDERHILLALPKHAGGDEIAAASALTQFLEHRDKQVEIAAYDFDIPQKFTFLKKTDQFQKRFPHLQKFMITVDVKEAGVQELSYDVKDQKLHIFVTPKTSYLTQQHVTTAQSEFRYDVIITLGVTALNTLGELYTNNTDLFNTLPIINIDHQAHNERFGNVNIVDVTACATSEVVAHIIQELDDTAIDEPIATSLLTGMIFQTQSFKSEHIKPKSLALASQLVTLGADRQRIIKELYQTKTLSMLRLWGQALAHMNYDKALQLVSSTITRDDFARSGAKEDELYDIIEELIANSPEEKMTLLLHEHTENGNHLPRIHGILDVEKGYNALELTATFNPTGNEKRASFVIEGRNLKAAEDSVIEEVKSKIMT